MLKREAKVLLRRVFTVEELDDNRLEDMLTMTTISERDPHDGYFHQVIDAEQLGYEIFKHRMNV